MQKPNRLNHLRTQDHTLTESLTNNLKKQMKLNIAYKTNNKLFSLIYTSTYSGDNPSSDPVYGMDQPTCFSFISVGVFFPCL